MSIVEKAITNAFDEVICEVILNRRRGINLTLMIAWDLISLPCVILCRRFIITGCLTESFEEKAEIWKMRWFGSSHIMMPPSGVRNVSTVNVEPTTHLSSKQQ